MAAPSLARPAVRRGRPTGGAAPWSSGEPPVPSARRSGGRSPACRSVAGGVAGAGGAGRAGARRRRRSALRCRSGRAASPAPRRAAPVGVGGRRRGAGGGVPPVLRGADAVLELDGRRRRRPLRRAVAGAVPVAAVRRRLPRAAARAGAARWRRRGAPCAGARRRGRAGRAAGAAAACVARRLARRCRGGVVVDCAGRSCAGPRPRRRRSTAAAQRAASPPCQRRWPARRPSAAAPPAAAAAPPRRRRAAAAAAPPPPPPMPSSLASDARAARAPGASAANWRLHAAQRGAVLAAAGAVAHVAAGAAGRPHAAVVGDEQVLADLGAVGVARLGGLDEPDARAHEQRLDGGDR